VGLDFDPILACQDCDIGSNVEKTTIKDGRCWAEVHGGRDKSGNSELRVIPELALKDGKWEFVNFHYPNPERPEFENLLSLLENLREFRARAQAQRAGTVMVVPTTRRAQANSDLAPPSNRTFLDLPRLAERTRNNNIEHAPGFEYPESLPQEVRNLFVDFKVFEHMRVASIGDTVVREWPGGPEVQLKIGARVK